MKYRDWLRQLKALYHTVPKRGREVQAIDYERLHEIKNSAAPTDPTPISMAYRKKWEKQIAWVIEDFAVQLHIDIFLLNVLEEKTSLEIPDIVDRPEWYVKELLARYHNRLHEKLIKKGEIDA